VVDLVASAVEHAEALARGGAVKAAAELAARREEEKQGGPNPVVNALRQAAIDLLADCETQCLNEAALVREIGGLQVVGTALHDSRRVDNQLRGRAGRQGDPGSTIFCLSMEDDLMRVYCPGWASSSVWDWSGMDDDTPLYSKVVDDQLATIQTQIEDFHATHRASTFDTDRIIDGQREAIYAVRRKVLEEGQAPLRERLVRYVEWIVDDACDRAGVDGRSEISDWRIDDMLEDLRSVFSSRRDQWLRESGRATGSNPHFLPGVDAEHIKDALLKKGDMPTGLPLPSLDAPAELVAAAIAGVDVRDMRGGESDKNAKQVADTEPEASESAVFARVERRLFDEKKRGSASMGEEAKRNRGVNAGESRLLRAYLSETAIALYLDRFARLSRHYDRADLEAVERVWVLRAIDERWQRHIVEMQVLRNSGQRTRVRTTGPDGGVPHRRRARVRRHGTRRATQDARQRLLLRRERGGAHAGFRAGGTPSFRGGGGGGVS
jgi:preprotein translocase subunit SecA